MLSLQVSGLTSGATTATAGVQVRFLADHHLALEIHRLGGSQKLEGSKTELGFGFNARCVDIVGVVDLASTDETEVIVTSGRFLLLLPSSHIIFSISNKITPVYAIGDLQVHWKTVKDITFKHCVNCILTHCEPGNKLWFGSRGVMLKPRRCR